MESKLEELIEELESQVSFRRSGVVRSDINQPTMIAINSANATNPGSADGFSDFTINMPRSVIDVETIQLVNANIPQCVQNIPNTACVFWYYRLSEYSGKVPNPNNLYMVRLLPTNYKPEYIQNPELYGFNKTFADYPSVASELALSCQNDLGYYNSIAYDGLFSPDRNYVIPFLPSEISITYNSGINKFQLTGTNATTQLAYKEFSIGTTYAEGDVVYIEDEGAGTQYVTFISLQNGNTGNAPPNTTWWKQIYVDVVRQWDADTPYFVGRYVSYLDQLYQCIQNSLNNDPFTSPAYWTEITTSETNYRYLPTGYKDPNVALMQATGNQLWNEFALFEAGNVVEHLGAFWEASYQNQGIEPFSTLTATAWNNTTLYRKGDVVSDGGIYYKAKLDNTNQTPSVFSPYWTQQAWVSTATLPNVVGLYSTTSSVDMVENLAGGGTLIPFPVGVAGQPYSVQPKRILNSILGFTWNGVMTPSVLANIPQQAFVSVIPTGQIDLYNRLRPIPPYITSQAPPLLGLESTSTTSQTYTAEGYCNLVYSSIINIYASVVYGTTLDTQKNANLLAMGTMNAGNLGISYFSPFINNPLGISGSDLYSIEFSFTDEFGDPYYFTNNAVISIVLKLTYKKDEQKL